MLKTVFKMSNWYGEDWSTEFYKNLQEANAAADAAFENLSRRDKARHHIQVEPVVWDSEAKDLVGINADSDHNKRLLMLSYDSDAPEVSFERCGDELSIRVRGVGVQESTQWMRWELEQETEESDIIDLVIDDVKDALQAEAKRTPELSPFLFGVEKGEIEEKLETILSYL